MSNPTERPRPDWDHYAMAIAEAAAERSPDPYKQVGAVGLRIDKTIAGTGYNGAKPGLEIDWSDRDARLPYVIHAEVNCLSRVKRGEVVSLYTTLLPCGACLRAAKRKRVREIIYRDMYYRDTSALKDSARLGILLRKL
jgi:dCMP deaminase